MPWIYEVTKSEDKDPFIDALSSYQFKSNDEEERMEILLGTTAVKTSIREGKSHLISNVIQTSAELGMQTLEQDLARLINGGKVTIEKGLEFSLEPQELQRLVKK